MGVAPDDRKAVLKRFSIEILLTPKHWVRINEDMTTYDRDRRRFVKIDAFSRGHSKRVFKRGFLRQVEAYFG